MSRFESDAMNSREQSDMPSAPSYPSPNAAQMGQGAMHYYANRQLTADELLTAELARETSGSGLADGSSNGVHHGQSMVLGTNNAGEPSDMGRPSSPDQHQQQHMLQFTPGQQVGTDPNHDLSYGDQSARRKRSKISRACDECRRKKVRCDASTESGVETCSNCRRLGVVCQFSRVPMKRGPSKGYIKELAERLHTLENQMQPAMVHPDMQYQAMNEVSPPRPYQEFSPPIDTGSINRKRTYSVFEGLPSSFSQPPFNPRGSQNAFDAAETTTDPCNPSVMASSGPKPGNLFWPVANNEDGLPAGMDMPEVSKHPEEDMTPMDIDDGALNAYYVKIHPVFPILPHSKDRLLEVLHQCSREIQEVFLYALYTVTRTDRDRVVSTFEKVTSFDNAQDLLLYYTRQPALVRSTPVNLIWLQATLLMILDCDARGPDNFVLKDGVPKHTLIQTATKLGSDMAKYQGQLKTKRTADADVDSDANLTRRSWVTLAILSRWYAISVADPSALGNYEIGGREDERVVGSVTTGVGIYSSFLVEMVTLATSDHNVCQTNTGLGRIIGANLASSLERLSEVQDLRGYHAPEESSPDSFLESLQNQLYWTIRLLIKRHIYVYSPYEIIYSAEEVINELHRATFQSRLATPFDIHSLALASMTLLEASVLPEYATECWDALDKLEEILDRRSKRTTTNASGNLEFHDVFATPGWDHKIRIFLEWRRAKAQESQLQEPASPVAPGKAESTGAGVGAGSSSTGAGSGSGSGAAAGAGAGAAAAPLGPNEQRSLQHLADLAVGAEGSVATGGANPSTPPPTGPPALPSTDNNTSPNVHVQTHQPSHGRIVVDFTLLTKEGYMNVFSGLIYRRPR